MSSPHVDLVLLFQCAPPHALQAGAQADAYAAADAAIASEYARLVAAIRSVGMRFTARPGADKGTVLLFVQATSEALVGMRRAENMKDFLHGASGPPGPGAASRPFSPAERIRFTHALLTSPIAADSGAGHGQPAGAGLGIKSEAYPHLLDIAPLHDPEYNRVWLERWTKLGSLLAIKDADLDDLRAQFGEHVAVYFAFLASYFTSLLFLAPIAVLFWARGSAFSLSYSVLLVSWSLLFTEVWRMRERKLSVRWGTYGTEAVAERRADFKPRETRTDEATGEKQEVFEWWRREARMAASLPVMLFFAALLGATLTTMFAVEVFATKLYDGVGAAMLPQVPTILFATAVPQIMGAWQATAKALTKWENHYSAQNHNDALTLKTFSLQAFVSYGALTLSALVYIPFGQSLMNELVSRGYFAGHISRALARGTLHHTSSGEVAFDINAARMHNQLFAVLTTTQAIGAFTELVLPFLLRKVAEYRKQRSEGARTPKGGEAKFLARVAKEMELPPYETFGDYAEMATQFGYIVLWSTIWPLAPIMALVNNFFELRSDALKVCLNARRPVPRRSATIGPWLDVLSFIAWLAALSNAALVYLFQQAPEAHLEGHSVYETKMRTHHADVTVAGASSGSSARYCPLVPSFLPCSSAASALVAGLLLALVAERGYSVLRAGVRHTLERALWRGSKEETQLRRRDWQARQMAVAQHGIAGGAPTPMPPALPDKEGSADGAFWDAAADESSNSIAGVQKRE